MTLEVRLFLMSNKLTTRQATVMGSVNAFTNSGLNFLLTNVLPSEIESKKIPNKVHQHTRRLEDWLSHALPHKSGAGHM